MERILIISNYDSETNYSICELIGTDLYKPKLTEIDLEKYGFTHFALFDVIRCIRLLYITKDPSTVCFEDWSIYDIEEIDVDHVILFLQQFTAIVVCEDGDCDLLEVSRISRLMGKIAIAYPKKG